MWLGRSPDSVHAPSPCCVVLNEIVWIEGYAVEINAFVAGSLSRCHSRPETLGVPRPSISMLLSLLPCCPAVDTIVVGVYLSHILKRSRIVRCVGGLARRRCCGGDV